MVCVILVALEVALSPGHSQLLMLHAKKLGVAWGRGYLEVHQNFMQVNLLLSDLVFIPNLRRYFSVPLNPSESNGFCDRPLVFCKSVTNTL